MFLIDANKIRTLLFERGLTMKAFKEQSGLNGWSTRKSVRDGSKVSAKVIATLAKFFNVDGNELILKE